MTWPSVDLGELAELLHQKLQHASPFGYLRGKSLMRDLLVREGGYSELQAETLIDTLEALGYLHYRGDITEPSLATCTWDISPTPRDY